MKKRRALQKFYWRVEETKRFRQAWAVFEFNYEKRMLQKVFEVL